MASQKGLDEVQVREAYERAGGNVANAAEILGVARGTVYHHVRKLGLDTGKPLVGGRVSMVTPEVMDLPKRGVKRYILTCVQNNTWLNYDFWDNLVALAAHYSADILISEFTYNQNNHGKLSVKPGTKAPHQTELWYDPEVEPYIRRKPVQLAPTLVWCAEQNTLPTDVRPLSGFATYAHAADGALASGVFPHAKIAMESVPTMRGSRTRMNYTTGTITQRNYIQKRAGMKGEFHHGYGAMLVEVLPDGRWFTRQLNGDRQSRIYDLDLLVDKEEITDGHRPESLTFGDLHEMSRDEANYQTVWAEGGMLDQLDPLHQFFHDTLDFRLRSMFYERFGLHHERFRDFVRFGRRHTVEGEVKDACDFLTWARRPGRTKTLAVSSNHDNFMLWWLQKADYRKDPENARYFLEAQSWVYKWLEENPKGSSPNIMRWACERVLGAQKDMQYLDEDASFITCKKYGGIENALHGHNRINGFGKGHAALARVGMKANIGHEHTAGIYDGLYVGGLKGDEDQGYNRGLQSWSNTDIITHKNAKRQMITHWGTDWRG